MRTVRGITIILLVSLLLLPAISHPVKAVNILPKTGFNIDTSVINQADNFNLPDSIIICPIFLQNDLLIQDSEWYEGLFYFEAVRLNQGDFLAHYFITKDGQVLQGNSKGDEQRLQLTADSLAGKPVVIVYLAGADQTDFTPAAKTALQQLLLQVANNDAIKLTKISVKSLSYQLTTNQPVAAKFDVLGGRWDISLKDMITAITPQYQPVIKQYNLTVSKVDLPAAAVNFGDDVQIGITITNNSSFVLYQGTDYEPLISKLQNSGSKFYLNGVWLSQTQAPLMSEGSLIKPGESKIFTIKFRVPLYFDLQQEDFQLINALGKPYPGTNFTVSMTINHPSQQVIEITSTETGQLNVRDGPWASSSVIGKVTPGQRFFVLDRTDSGYVKLDIGNGKLGWVVSKYTKVV